MREIERANVEKVDARAKCRRHPDTGRLVYEVTTERVECTACLRGARLDRPQKLTEAMARDMARLGIDPHAGEEDTETE